MLKAIVASKYTDLSLRCHDTEAWTRQALFAATLIEQWGMIGTEEEVVDRAFNVAELFCQRARADGLFVDVTDEVAELIELTKAKEETT